MIQIVFIKILLQKIFRIFPLFLTILALTIECIAEPVFWLTVNHGEYPGSECIEDKHERDNAFMLGMTGTLVVMVEYPDSINLPFSGVSDWTWPQGMSVEACISNDTTAADFQPSTIILDKLALRYFVQKYQAFEDSMWRFKGILPASSRMSYHTQYWFQFDLAEEWADKYLCFRAHYISSRYGDLTSEERCFRISAPCSAADSALIHLGNIVCAGMARDYSQALAITDSLLNSGWIDARALIFARQFAYELHDYTSCLRYLDITYQHYGTVHPEGIEVHSFTPESRTRYEEVRQNILRRKAEYDLQQQK